MEEEPEDTRKVADGHMSATEYLFKYCDGKFTNEDLNKEGNEFAAEYYGDDGLYLDDYTAHFADLMYVSPESSHDFQKFASILEKRLQTGVLTQAKLQEAKPWWNFW